ncbi:NAD-binding protein [Nocardia brasiliensis]|uniref:NAD-binding protein n=1 Tax=Nocardia brasiliensis TaxID=37326 RepID=UPI002457BB55|nr:NAD-binding protein [Nocardia brasiliensis]
MTGHTIVLGYANNGRSAAHTIVDADLESDLVVIDNDPARISAARRDGALPVLGDARDVDVLRSAGTSDAASVTVAVTGDNDAVRITSTVRSLNDYATICTALHSGGRQAIAEDLGADQVVVTSRLTGRLLGLSTHRPGPLAEFRHVLRQHPEAVVAEHPTRVSEIGQHPRQCSPLILAVLRRSRIRWRNDPQTSSLRALDRLLVLRAQWPTR